MRRLTVAISALLALSGCHNRDGCYGGIVVSVPFPEGAPRNVEVIWQGKVILNKCQNIYPGVVLVREQPNQLEIDDMGWGNSPPASFTLQITDLGDCQVTPTTVVAVVDRPVQSDRNSCAAVAVELKR